MRECPCFRFARWTVAIALVGLPAVSAQAAERADSATQTIRLISSTVNYRVAVDRPPKGTLSKGDVLREESVLRNLVAQLGRPKGAQVGSDVGTYTVVSTTPPQMNVKVVVKLPGGTLRGTARVTGPAMPKLRIVGGTGNFANARGTGEVRSYKGRPGEAINIYRLQLP